MTTLYYQQCNYVEKEKSANKGLSEHKWKVSSCCIVISSYFLFQTEARNGTV